MPDKGRIYVAEQDGVVVIKLCGDIRLVLCTSIDDYIDSIFKSDMSFESVIVDAIEADAIDSTSLGMLAKLALHSKSQFSIVPEIICANESIKKLLLSVGFDTIFTVILAENYTKIDDLRELKASSNLDESSVRDRVIDAHRTLMDLNSKNKQAFQELVDNLEKEKGF